MVPRTPAGMSPVWRLRPDEAVVYLGKTPPAAKYFSYTPYIFDRLNAKTGMRASLMSADRIEEPALGSVLRR